MQTRYPAIWRLAPVFVIGCVVLLLAWLVMRYQWCAR